MKRTNPVSRKNVTRDHIIRAALRTFEDRGYSGATTRAIAHAAGVNEVTLFRRFGGKDALLEAALAEKSPIRFLGADLNAHLSGRPRVDMPIIAAHVAHFTRKNRKVLVRSLCAAEDFPAVRKIVAKDFARQREGLERLLAAFPRERAGKGFAHPEASCFFLDAILGLCLRLGADRRTTNKAWLKAVDSHVKAFIRSMGSA